MSETSTTTETVVRWLTRPHSRLPGGGRLGRIVVQLGLYILAAVLALGLSSVLIVIATDASPTDVYRAMYRGSLGSASALGLTLDRMTPILIVALGGIIATRAAMFNIGLEGQLAVGGMFGAVAALKFGLPPALGIPAMLIFGMIGGGLWAGIASLMRFWRGVDVVISTLLLNFVAVQVISYAINQPWLLQETSANRQKLPQSDRLPEAAQIPRIGSLPGFSVSTAIFLAIALALVTAFFLSRSPWGFKLKMLGMSPRAAQAAGVSMVAVGGMALVVSGAFAGLAGGVLFGGTSFRIQPGFSANVGNDGLLAALIARRNAVATIPVAFFFGAMRAGGGFLATTGVPRYLVDVVQPLLVLAALLPPAIMFLWDRRQALRAARSEARHQTEVSETVGAAA